MQNPDSVLAVRFYQKEVQNDFQTQVQGRPIMEMRDFVRIEIPGNTLSIIDTFVNEDHKQRFPIHWARYLNEKAENAVPSDIQGTSLKDWPLLNAAQAAELRHYKFYTVDQIAAASDLQLQTVGMLAGMDPMSLRDKAKAFLKLASDSSEVAKQDEELKKRDQQIQEMQAQIQELLANQKRGPGRPPKEAA